MWIGLGLLILCVIFTVFGSKTEEAYVLYYTIEEAANFGDGELLGGASEEYTASKEVSSEDVEKDSNDPSKIARDIYNDITL